MDYNKANKADIDGSGNIVLQDVQESTITLNVNGDVQQIQNDLGELKRLMQQMQVQNLQHGQNSYNIARLDETNFGFLIGKSAFNERLTLHLMEALKPYSPVAVKFLEKVKNRPEWEKEKRISSRAKDVITSLYVGVLGMQLRKLIAIGEETFSEHKVHRYLENSLLTAQYALELLIFILISGLWDRQQQNPVTYTKDQREALREFFGKTFEHDIAESLKVLQHLLAIYQTHEMNYPIPELADWQEQAQNKSNFVQACRKMQELRKTLDANHYTALDAFEAEKQLTTILSSLGFLASYRMVSMKAINYEEMRSSNAYYLHNYEPVGGKAQPEQNTRVTHYTHKPVPTDAVLLFKGNYQDSINLFPFIIDLNALTNEGGLKICFYASRDFDTESLVYRFLDTGNMESVPFRDVYSSTLKSYDNDEQGAMNAIMDAPELHKHYKLDMVNRAFNAAEETVLNEDDETEDSGEPDFSDLGI